MKSNVQTRLHLWELCIAALMTILLLGICWQVKYGVSAQLPKSYPVGVTVNSEGATVNLGNIGHTRQTHLIAIRRLLAALDANSKAPRVVVLWSGILKSDGKPFTNKLEYDREKKRAIITGPRSGCNVSEKEFRRILQWTLKSGNANLLETIWNGMGCA